MYQNASFWTLKWFYLILGESQEINWELFDYKKRNKKTMAIMAPASKKTKKLGFSLQQQSFPLQQADFLATDFLETGFFFDILINTNRN